VVLGVVLHCDIFSVQHRTDYCVSVVIQAFNVAVSNDGVLASEFFRMISVTTPDMRMTGLC